MRTWLVTLLLLGIGTAGAMNFWRDRTEDPEPAASEEAVGTSPADPLGDGEVLEVFATEEIAAEEIAAEPDSAGPDAVVTQVTPTAVVTGGPQLEAAGNEAAVASPPVELTAANAATPDEVDRLGGATVAAEGEARRNAMSLVEQAARSTDPVEQSNLLSRAVLGGALDQVAEANAYEALLDANRRGILNPRVSGLCSQVVVEKGDSLWLIGRKAAKDGNAGCTPGLIRLVNGMTSDHLRAGAKLKIPNQPVSLVVEKPKYRLSVLFGDVLLKRYLVGLGKDNKTPEGDFTIKTRLIDPPWFKPGVGEIPPEHPENVLGTRWLGFAEKDGFPEAATFGIHGTREDNSIGTQSSNGCVRMHNAEVEELFEWIGEGVKVTIRP